MIYIHAQSSGICNLLHQWKIYIKRVKIKHLKVPHLGLIKIRVFKNLNWFKKYFHDLFNVLAMIKIINPICVIRKLSTGWQNMLQNHLGLSQMTGLRSWSNSPLPRPTRFWSIILKAIHSNGYSITIMELQQSSAWSDLCRCTFCK